MADRLAKIGGTPSPASAGLLMAEQTPDQLAEDYYYRLAEARSAANAIKTIMNKMNLAEIVACCGQKDAYSMFEAIEICLERVLAETRCDDMP